MPHGKASNRTSNGTAEEQALNFWAKVEDELEGAGARSWPKSGLCCRLSETHPPLAPRATSDGSRWRIDESNEITFPHPKSRHRPTLRFNRRTMRPPRYLATSTAGISFRLA
jgi:hypothetical protein